MNYIRKYKLPIILFLVVSGLMFTYFGFIGTGNNASIDNKPEGNDTDFSSQANIVNGDELLKELGSLEAFKSLSRDLHTFGQTAYEPYKADGNRVVGFEVTKVSKTNDSKIEVEGRYGSSSNLVELKLVVLKNSRINSSITDKKTLLNIDPSLPSNSRINQFIGSLPINKDGYDINYVPDDGVEITLYSRDPELYDLAYKELIEEIGEEELSNITLSVSYPPPTSID